MSYIGDIARTISKTIAGDNGSISKAFSKEALSNLGDSAVRATQVGKAESFIAEALSSGGLSKEAYEQAVKDGGKSFDSIKYAQDFANSAKAEGNEKFAKALENYAPAKEAFEAYQSNGSAAKYFNKEALDSDGIGIKNTLKGYFKDPEVGATRTKATIGAAATGAVGVRYLSGGNLTTNAQGERDIAGIPFI